MSAWPIAIRLAALAGLACAPAHGQQIYPPDPVQGEQIVFTQVLCRPTYPTFLASSSATLGSGGFLNFVLDFDGSDFSAPSCGRGTVASPPLPAGPLTIRYSSGMELPVEPVTLLTLQVPSAVAATPLYTNLSGNWFDPATSGTGVNLIQGESRQIFAVWFTYQASPDGDAKAATWLVMPAGRWIGPTRFRGLMYLTQGSPMNHPWAASELQVTPAGVMTLTFDSPDQVRFQAITLEPTTPDFTVNATLKRFLF